MKNYFFIIVMNLLSGCSNKTQNISIVITPKPVFFEIDTSINVIDNKPFSKHDYFLISGAIDDKVQLKNGIESFVKENYGKECSKYGNYVMFFYRRSSEVNERTIRNQKLEFRYKIFLYNKDEEYIASFTCWKGIPGDRIDFRPKYQ